MLKIGDIVLCRFYNTPDHRFYGDYWKGQVLAITGYKENKLYQVKMLSWGYVHTLERKEIKRIVKG